MAAVAAQYINLTPIVVWGILLYFVAPFVACFLAGLVGTRGPGGAFRGALCGVLTVMVSVAGCSAVVEYDFDTLTPNVAQALATTALGAVVTFWVVDRDFWNN